MRTTSRLIATIALSVGLSAGVLAPAALAQSQQEVVTHSAVEPCDHAKDSARTLLKMLKRMTNSNDTQFLINEVQWVRDNYSSPELDKFTARILNGLKNHC